MGKLTAPTRLYGLINIFLIKYNKLLIERIAYLANIYQDLGYFPARFNRVKSIVIPKVDKAFKEKINIKA